MSKIIQESGEFNGRPIGNAVLPVETDNPIKACTDRILELQGLGGYFFDASSKSTDHIIVSVIDVDGNGKATPLATAKCDRSGIHSQPASLIFNYLG